jgi:phosphoribosylformimino-5-aminoimidazole carboxamide ribotide isomerase
VDLDGAKAGKPVNGSVVRKIVEAAGVPVQLGGGLRTHDDLAAAFDWGVHWAVIGTRAIQDPAFIWDTATSFPNRIVLGIDAKNGFVATDGWLTVSKVKAVELVEMLGDPQLAGVVYTDIAKDGMMSGPNFEALAEMQAVTPMPVIASGGVCTSEHVARLKSAGTYGCIIGRALYEGSLDLANVLALARSPSGHG